jgi:hypothetical protein
MRSLIKTARRGFHYSILAIVPLLAGVGGANATIVASPVASYTQAFTLSGSQPSSFSLAAFNPALGTLTDILLTTVTRITPQVQLINLAGANQPFTDAQSTVFFYLRAPVNVSASASASTALTSGTAWGPKYAVSTFTGEESHRTQTAHLAEAIWDHYIGPASVHFQVDLGMVTSSASFVPGTLAVGGNGSATGDVTIAYTYEAVHAPIPAPFLLLGSGLIGLAGARKQWKGRFFGRFEN